MKKHIETSSNEQILGRASIAAACRTIAVCVLLLGMLYATSLAGEAAAENDANKAAIARALPLLVRSATTYTEKRDCFSCHHQALPAMVFSLAKKQDFAIDSAIVKRQSEFTHAYFAKRIEQLPNGNGVPGGPYTAGYALLGLSDTQWPKDEVTRGLIEYLLKTQHADGSWRIRTHRPPLEDSHFTATALAVRTLQLYAKDASKDARERARRWLVTTTAATHEDRAFRVLGMHWNDAPREAIAAARREIAVSQNSDGGWSQLPDMPSDAYATGQALVAMRLTTIREEPAQERDEPVAAQNETAADMFLRGEEYLRRTQQDDGSWYVKTRSKPIQVYFESDFPHAKSQFISICGTCWGTMALLYALGDAREEKSRAGSD